MLRSSYFGTLKATLEPAFPLGDTPEGHRLVVNATGGTLEGPSVSAEVMRSGGDWARIRNDGSGAVDVRGLLRADDGSLLGLRFEGRFLIPPPLMTDVFAPSTDTPVDSSRYYFRIAAYFETSSKEYAWLNRSVFVGVGAFGRNAVSYDLYEIQ